MGPLSETNSVGPTSEIGKEQDKLWTLSGRGNLSSELTVGLSYDEDSNSIGRVPSTESSRQRSVLAAYEKMGILDTVLDEYRYEIRAKRNTGIHERLYEEGRAKELQKALAVRKKMKEQEDVPPPKLQMATRSYTPQRQGIFDEIPAHERLYKMGDYKKRLEIEREARLAAERLGTKMRPVTNPNSGSRLYAQSKPMQEEGKMLRQKIEEKRRARTPTPSRVIPPSKATAIYDRGLQAKQNTKKKIEEMRKAPRGSTFPKMRTQTPNRRDRYFEARDSDDTTTRSRHSTPSRTRNSTPSRTRNSTPSRTRYPTPNRTRSSTPSHVRNPTSSHGGRPQTPSHVRDETPLRSRKSSQRPLTSSQKEYMPHNRASSRTRTSSRQRERSQTPSRRTSSTSYVTSARRTDEAASTPKLPRSFKVNPTE